MFHGLVQELAVSTEWQVSLKSWSGHGGVWGTDWAPWERRKDQNLKHPTSAGICAAVMEQVPSGRSSPCSVCPCTEPVIPGG